MNESILDAIRRAGLTVAEFAALCGVSRIAVYNWNKGGAINTLRKPKVEKILAAMSSAVKTRDLPPKTPMGGGHGEDRHKEIKATIVKHLKKRWPAT